MLLLKWTAVVMLICCWMLFYLVCTLIFKQQSPNGILFRMFWCLISDFWLDQHIVFCFGFLSMMNQIFPDQLVNHICCDILNRLLGSLNCFSAPISDLNELSNGVALVELIECYEDVTLIKSSDRKRDAIHRSQTNSNIDFIEKKTQYYRAKSFLNNGF